VEVTRAWLGRYTSISADAAGEGVKFWHRNEYRYVEDPPRKAPFETSESPPKTMAPFERADFGDRDRLSWPAGACSIEQRIQPTFWNERFATWFEDECITIIDATQPLVAHLRAPKLFQRYSSLLAHAGRLWLSREHTLGIPIDDIIALFAAGAGESTIRMHIREIYPARDPDRSVRARISRLEGGLVHARTLEDRQRDVTFPPHGAVAPGTEVTLFHELYEDHFLEVQFPREPRRKLYDTLPSASTIDAKLVIEPAIDPAGELARPTGDPAAREDDLARLFSILADEPDDDATRLVVVDSLEECGQPYAQQFAKLIAGDSAPLKEALGTLASYFIKLELHRGLPRGATLSSKAPLDEEIGDVVAADLRLGFFHTLRIGDGDYGLYAKLAASPRAAGLRHVDIPRVHVLNALVAANKRDLRRLSSLRFANREMIDGLADSTFDRATELEIETGMRMIGGLLTFIAKDEHKFFSRTPRHAILHTRSEAEFLAHDVLAAWDKLPLAAITFNGITLHRDGRAVAEEFAHAGAIEVVRKKFPKLELPT